MSFMLSAAMKPHYAECHYTECHYAECHYADWLYAECCGASVADDENNHLVNQLLA